MHPGASLPWPVRMLRHSRAGCASGAGGGVDHAGRTGAARHQGRTDVPAVGVRQAEVVQTACGVWRACVLFVLLLTTSVSCLSGRSISTSQGWYTRDPTPSDHPRPASVSFSADPRVGRRPYRGVV